MLNALLITEIHTTYYTLVLASTPVNIKVYLWIYLK